MSFLIGRPLLFDAALPAAFGTQSGTPPLEKLISRLHGVRKIERRHVRALGKPEGAAGIEAILGGLVANHLLVLRSPEPQAVHG
jgi:hypothetical protein